MAATKATGTILALLFCAGFVSAQCDVDLGRSGSTTPLILNLEAGIPKSVRWDFTDCAFGINDFTVYVTQPRRCRTCRQRSLPVSAPLMLISENLTTGQTGECPGFICRFGKVSGCEVQLILLAARSISVEVTYTASLSGPP